jgi:hypothetical protein
MDKAVEKAVEKGLHSQGNGLSCRRRCKTNNSQEKYMEYLHYLLGILVAALGVIVIGLEVQIVKLQARVKNLEAAKK